MIRLYDNIDSGNCYKIRLLLAHLGMEHERIEMDTEHGATRTPEFLAKNPNGRVPVLQTADEVYLAESGAIQWYLAEGTRYLPDDTFSRAQVLQWMFFEQYSHEPYVAVVRHWMRGAKHRAKPELVEEKMRLGYAALDVMETHLGKRDYFAANRYTIADISLFAYTHVAHQGNFSLERFPHIRAWIERVQAEPGHVPMVEAPRSLGGRS